MRYMTAFAVLNRIMRGTAGIMTGIACRYDFLSEGRMLRVAIHAPEIRVLGSLVLKVLGFCGVAFGAVGILQGDSFDPCKSAHTQKGNQQAAQTTRITPFFHPSSPFPSAVTE